MCIRSRKFKRPDNVSQLKKDPFAIHSNYSFEIVILVMFLKTIKTCFILLCLLCPLHFQEEGGVDGGEVLVKCSLTSKVGYLIKRGVYFETRRNYNIALLISKSENVTDLVRSDVHFLRQQLSNCLALFSNLISIQKRKQKRNCWHIIQKLK